MKRYIVQCNQNALKLLKQFGEVETVSELLNIYCIVIEQIDFENICDIAGVETVEQDETGYLVKDRR